MIRKYSVSIRGHRTSYSLESAFQQELVRIATDRGEPLARLIAAIDADRPAGVNLSSALRVYVLTHLKSASSS